MGWLFFQTWIWLLIAALIGLFIGWLIWRNSSDTSGAEIATLRRQLEECRNSKIGAQPAQTLADTSQAVEQTISDDWKPVALDGPDGSADDLKRISGVGPVIEKTLNGLGIYHFRQISAFSADNIKWIDNYIDFPGRVEREGWVEQSRKLDEGIETDFSQRYDKRET